MLSKWPEKVKTMQNNWIESQLACNLSLRLQLLLMMIKQLCRITRPDMSFGASFVAVAADHPIVKKLEKNNCKINSFIKECRSKGTT